MTLGVDVGGTFTDLVRWDGGRLHVSKASSTSDQSVGVAAAAADLIGDERSPLMVHGTTVATNALLERSGASVALVTDPGFEDLIEIGRQDRPSLYDHDIVRPDPLVPRSLRFTSPPVGIDVDAIVVMLLGSFADPGTESALASTVADRSPGGSVIRSTDVSREFREFERLSTAVLTAYLRPVVERYLSSLESRVVGRVVERLLVMQSSGGLVPAASAGRNAASILLSGPAGGVVAAAAYGSIVGDDTVISFDMGGTSTDVCRIEGGAPEIAYERSIEGYVCRLPSVAVHTVGAGGGSVAWIDDGGALRVGPRSAGADPGPASYGRGGVEATVTDADLFSGRLPHDVDLAGGLRLDAATAAGVLGVLGDRVGLTVGETAMGIIEIVEAHMERAVRRVSVEEGADPGEAALVAFGGAGGLHAVELGRRLGVGRVVVPPFAGVLSALGLLLARPRTDVAVTVLAGVESHDRLDRGIEGARSAVTARHVEAVGAHADSTTIVCDMRYVGQAHETPVPHRSSMSWLEMTEAFHAAHRRLNGFDRPGDPVEVVTIRATATGRPSLRPEDLPAHRPSGDSVIGTHEVLTPAGGVTAPVMRRPGLVPGREVDGPVVVVDGVSTTFVPSGSRMVVHESGALVIDDA